MLPASRSGTREIAAARHAGGDALDARRFRGRWHCRRRAAVDVAAGDLPASAILQSAAASMVEGILVVTVSTAERIATRGRRARCEVKVDGVLHDVTLGIESGKMLMAASVMKSVSA